MDRLNRRRFLLIATASATGIAAGQRDLSTPADSLDGEWPVVRRLAFALGTEVCITVRHSSAKAADEAITAAFAELSLVERLMSIYRRDSQLSTLNQVGQLDDPHPYVVRVLRQAKE